MRGQHKGFNQLDIIGSKFNSFTVVSFEYSKKNKYQFDYFYKCKCECGKEIIVSRHSLINGITKNCGCKHNLESLLGKKIGKLLVVSYDDNIIRGKGRKCICKCDCGNTYVTWDRIIRYGNRQSCGCLEAERTQGTYRHGFCRKDKTNRLYKIWSGMKDRCYNKNNPEFCNYGGREIIVCQQWLDDFINFKDWALENGYSEKLTIDRIDNNGNYSPENCRWADRFMQGNNKRNCIFISYKGKTQTLAQWSRETGINRTTLKYRYSQGYTTEKIFKGGNV